MFGYLATSVSEFGKPEFEVFDSSQCLSIANRLCPIHSGQISEILHQNHERLRDSILRKTGVEDLDHARDDFSVHEMQLIFSVYFPFDGETNGLQSRCFGGDMALQPILFLFRRARIMAVLTWKHWHNPRRSSTTDSVAFGGGWCWR